MFSNGSDIKISLFHFPPADTKPLTKRAHPRRRSCKQTLPRTVHCVKSSENPSVTHFPSACRLLTTAISPHTAGKARHCTALHSPSTVLGWGFACTKEGRNVPACGACVSRVKHGVFQRLGGAVNNCGGEKEENR